MHMHKHALEVDLIQKAYNKYCPVLKKNTMEFKFDLFFILLLLWIHWQLEWIHHILRNQSGNTSYKSYSWYIYNMLDTTPNISSVSNMEALSLYYKGVILSTVLDILKSNEKKYIFFQSWGFCFTLICHFHCCLLHYSFINLFNLFTTLFDFCLMLSFILQHLSSLRAVNMGFDSLA